MKRLKKELQLHLEAFNFYNSLGAGRTYTQVAKKFNVQKNTVGAWAVSFKWADRIIEQIKKNNEVQFGEVQSFVGDFRKTALKLANYLQELNYHLLEIHKRSIEEKRPLTKEEEEMREKLKRAIDDFNTKTLRELFAYFKDNTFFAPSMQPPEKMAKAGISVTGPTVIMYGPKDKDGAKRLVQLTNTQKPLEIPVVQAQKEEAEPQETSPWA